MESSEQFDKIFNELKFKSNVENVTQNWEGYFTYPPGFRLRPKKFELKTTTSTLRERLAENPTLVDNLLLDVFKVVEEPNHWHTVNCLPQVREACASGAAFYMHLKPKGFSLFQHQRFNPSQSEISEYGFYLVYPGYLYHA